MTGDAPIRAEQYWTAKDADRLKSSSRVRVLRVAGNVVHIERFYIDAGNKPHHKKDRLTVKGLRRFYTLTHEQETLI